MVDLAGVYLSEIAPSIEKANDTRGGEGELRDGDCFLDMKREREREKRRRRT